MLNLKKVCNFGSLLSLLFAFPLCSFLNPLFFSSRTRCSKKPPQIQHQLHMKRNMNTMKFKVMQVDMDMENLSLERFSCIKSLKLLSLF